MIQLEEAKERLILVGVSEQDGDDLLQALSYKNGKRCIRALMLAREKWKK